MRIPFAGYALSATMALVPWIASANSLAELGYPNGITLQGSRGQGEVFFPMPANPVRPELRLRLNPSAMLDQLSSVQVLANDVPIASIPVRDGQANLTIPIPPALARNEFLRIRFQADQALQRDLGFIRQDREVSIRKCLRRQI